VRRDFVANASHELKTPLTAIRGYSETLLDEDLPAELRRQFTHTLHTHAARLQTILDDLLDLSRIESGGLALSREAVGIEEVARDAWGSTGAGATFAMPLITLWSSEYQDATGGRVNYNSIGSGGGIRAHIDRTVDFAASEAPLNAEQYERAPGDAHHPVHHRDGDGGLQPARRGRAAADGRGARRHLPGRDHALERPADRGAEPRRPAPGPPDRGGAPLRRLGHDVRLHRLPEQGEPRWREEVGSATSVAWPTGIGGNGNEGVAGAIRNNPYSIGYIELSYASNLGMPTAAIRNRAGNFVQPSLEAGTAAAAAAVDHAAGRPRAWTEVSFTDAPGADSYPISSFSYFFIYEDLDRLGRPT
jgi:phosphate transport system substrate-binding protein